MLHEKDCTDIVGQPPFYHLWWWPQMPLFWSKTENLIKFENFICFLSFSVLYLCRFIRVIVYDYQGDNC